MCVCVCLRSFEYKRIIQYLSTSLVQEHLLKQMESKNQEEQAEDNKKKSEREIKSESSEAWNEFRYSIDKS